MAIRLSGLSSGLDTEAIIKELMSAQSMKKTKIENKKTKLEWREEKWKDLNKKIYALYTDEISKLKTQGSYLSKGVSLSNDTKAKVTASTKAPLGTHTIEIQSIASSQFITGEKITDLAVKNEDGTTTTVSGKNIHSNTSLKSLGIVEGSTFTLTTKNGVEEFAVTSTSKISDLTTFAKKNDVNLSYDESNQRFFISSMESGVDHAFTLTSRLSTNAEMKKLSDLKKTVGYDYLSTKEQETVDAAIKVLTTSADITSKEYLNATQTLEQYAYACKKTEENPDSKDSANKFKEIFAKNLEDAKKDWSTLSQTADFANDVKDYKDAMSGYKTEYSSNTAGSALDILKIGEITKDANNQLVSTNKNTTLIDAKDCQIIYNGVAYDSSKNSITINGLTIEATEITTEPLKVNVTNNTDSVYNVIKNFTKKYNEILKEVNELYYAASSKGYDVLTEEQKEAMTEDEIEKWENKIKGSLLRNDTSLGNVRSALVSVTSMRVEVKGKLYSLADFGVGTADYTEKGLLHIDGDSDDSSTSAKTDKLKAAIQNDPDLVMEVFSSIGSQLYSELSEKMKSSSLSSALTFYNDKQITSQKKEYEREISKWEKKLAEIEERYYKQYSKMETAMAKLNSQSNYISSIFMS